MKNPFKECIPWSRRRKHKKKEDTDIQFQLKSPIEVCDERKRVNHYHFNKCSIWSNNDKDTRPLEVECQNDRLLKHDDSREHNRNKEKAELFIESPSSYLDEDFDSDTLYGKEKNVDTRKERLDDEEDNFAKNSMHTDYKRQQSYKSLLDLVPAFWQEIHIAIKVDICYRQPEYDIPVLLVETAAFTGKLEWRGIEVFCFQHNFPASLEGKDVFAREGTLQNNKAIEVSKVIQETQENYAKIHSNIEIISASRFKSKSYGKNWALEDTYCIVFYCRRKGFIPFLEEPFPKNIKGIPVDVREGMIETAAGFCSENVRSGITISAYGCRKIGTLGPIFDHPTYNNPCALTNAHVVLRDDRMWSLLHNIPTISDNDPLYITNPPVASNLIGNTDERIFGRVQKCAITKGGRFEAGTDVAVVQITSRFPDCGYFPLATEESLKEIGYSSNYPPLYQGEMQKNVEVWRYHDVIKFGAATGWTRGVPYLTSIFTRRCNFTPKGPLSYMLCNQIEIKSLQGSDFGKNGDSGSTIFYRREEDNQLVAVGLLNAVTSYGSTIVTPIADCLKAASLESLTHFKRFPDRTRGQNLSRNTNVNAVGHLAMRTLSKVSIEESYINKGSGNNQTMENSRDCLGSFLPNYRKTKVCRSKLAGDDSGYDGHSARSFSMTFVSNPQDQTIKRNICSAYSREQIPVGKCYPNPTNTESTSITEKASDDTLRAEGGGSLLHSPSHSLSLGLCESTSFVISQENKKIQVSERNSVLTKVGNQNSQQNDLLENDSDNSDTILHSERLLLTETSGNGGDSYQSFYTEVENQHANRRSGSPTPDLSFSTNHYQQIKDCEHTNSRSASPILADSTNHYQQQEPVSARNISGHQTDAKYLVQSSDALENHQLRGLSLKDIHEYTDQATDAGDESQTQPLETFQEQQGTHLHSENVDNFDDTTVNEDNNRRDVDCQQESSLSVHLHELAMERERILKYGIDGIVQMVGDYVKGEREYAKDLQKSACSKRFQTN